MLLAYNDFHMSYYDSAFQPRQDVFCIDHCREGRLEYPVGKDAYSYVEAGDLKLDRRLTHVEHFEMPEVPDELCGGTASFRYTDQHCRSGGWIGV